MNSPFQRITIDGRLLEGDDILNWSEALMRDQGNAPWTVDLHNTLNELLTGTGAVAAQTSGTTGEPKPITIPASDLIASAKLTETAFNLRPGDRTLLCLPCTFVAGKMMVVRAFVTGLDLHVIDPTGPVLPKLLNAGAFRFATMVPQQLLTALRADRDQVERQFDTVLLGGGPVSDVLIAELGGLRTAVFLSYGSTETVTHVALRKLNEPEATVQFTALGPVTFSFDQRGCLIIATPHLSTKQHVTNDIVEVVDELRFHWLGRADNVILSGGLKIHPEQLEARTTGLIAPAHYFIGMPDDSLGQCVAIVVEAGSIGPTERAQLDERLSKVLAKHERPRQWIVRHRFDRTTSGKIIRHRR